MDLDDFKENVLTDDIAFKYKGKEYFIFLFDKSFTVGEYGTEKDLKFGKYEDIYKNRDDMFNNWKFGSLVLKDIVNCIEID
ncbi:hypothetical protein JW813_05090 [Clostridium botulinum]|uniref:hypothetical protein n=1 Tax=Clostridium botulinum TaxID=1491 RepID=UPI0006A6E49C|nr:hypothetical protein [Clostridium botulinum]KAI3349042.1 hypothetical protein CIT18_10450 [Clostridium botulinum]KOM88020.1 hypothetical protein ACP51_10680 [Clostridium botulinum]KOR62010.1 hypothetical protein ADT22_05620 [Clostridium botulinum]MBY7023641.1 hypothetical protein [Clostridium botulinum]NFN80282.1 hypothetical protein [Clostridium botulinum]